MVKSIQSLRYIFAIIIFLHHFIVDGKGLFDAGGPLGVSFFIILSGVVMSLGYYEKCNSPLFLYKSFILKRIIRLYPLHLLCLTIYIIMNPGVYHLGGILQLIPNLLMLQSWIPIQNVYFSGNAVSWCLADMMFFYATFPFLVKYFKKTSTTKLFYTLGVIYIIYFIFVINIPDQYSHCILYISPLVRLLDFIVGIGIYNFYIKFGETIRNHFTTITSALLGICIILILFISIILYKHISINFTYAFMYMIPISLLITYALIFNNKRGGVLNIFNNRILYKMGEVSFSFYMIHILSIQFFNKIIDYFGLVIEWEIKLIIYLILISFASLLIYNIFEKPISKYLQKKLIS